MRRKRSVSIAPRGGRPRRLLQIRHCSNAARALCCTLLAVLPPATARATPPGAGVPRLDRVIVVVFENHSYDEVRVQPYTASLIASGTSFSQSHAIGHPSQPNYIALWSGSTQGVTDDACPAPGSPFATENLGHACEGAGLTWAAYSENRPAPGFTGCTYDNRRYTRKHEPWTNFGNVSHDRERPFGELAVAESLGNLPNLTFVIPNNCNNTHDCGLAAGDAWLAGNVPGLLRTLGPNGLLILTWDEDDHSAGNQILTVFVGPRVTPGIVSSQAIDHYGVLRTICEALGLTPFGAAASASSITGMWRSGTAVHPSSWSMVKGLFR